MNEPITRRDALKKGALFGGAALVWVRPSVNSYGMSSILAASVSGTQGCTPGFWKNNPGRALELAGVDIETTPVPFAEVATGPATMIEALGYNGGGGQAGAERILLRAASAGYLNSIALAGLYGTQALGSVNEAITSGNRSEMLALASAIDAENNAGCPFPADEADIKKNQDGESTSRPSEQVLDQKAGDTEPEAGSAEPVGETSDATDDAGAEGGGE